MNTYTAIIHRERDYFVALCPETGTVSQGNNIDEAIKNLKEATELYLEEFPLSHISRSLITTFEVASVASQ
jgi:predicted RNase H-like HicB family nuclease